MSFATGIWADCVEMHSIHWEAVLHSAVGTKPRSYTNRIQKGGPFSTS